MKRFAYTVLAGITIFQWPVANAFADEASVKYPDGYRDWTHVKTMVIQEGHALYEPFGGIHHLYANTKALEGYRTGSFPDGAVITFDLLETSQSDHSITEGSRKVLGVMEKDQRRFKDTGGWGFEGFAAGDPTQRVVKENADAACFQCHTSQESHDYVFSKWRK